MPIAHPARSLLPMGRHAAARVPHDQRPARARPWRRGSPDPVPNSAVKPAVAESTAAPGCGRIGSLARAGRFPAPWGPPSGGPSSCPRSNPGAFCFCGGGLRPRIRACMQAPQPAQGPAPPHRGPPLHGGGPFSRLPLIPDRLAGRPVRPRPGLRPLAVPQGAPPPCQGPSSSRPPWLWRPCGAETPP